MVICPVCNEKVYIRRGRVIPHGSNESLCYGSYMAARDCRYAGPTNTIKRGLFWLIQKLLELLEQFR